MGRFWGGLPTALVMALTLAVPQAVLADWGIAKPDKNGVIHLQSTNGFAPHGAATLVIKSPKTSASKMETWCSNGLNMWKARKDGMCYAKDAPR